MEEKKEEAMLQPIARNGARARGNCDQLLPGL